MRQPNVLLIMVDQMTAQAVGALGETGAQTPNLDRLVASGASFTNAYCNSPLCVPARASFMTGLLPRTSEVWDNGSELPASAPTISHHLSRAGYRTVLAGKMHFVGPDQHHGFEERLTGDISLPGLTLTPDWTRGAHANEGSSVERLKEPQVVDWTLQMAFDEEVLSTSLARLRKFKQRGEKFFLCASFTNPHDPFRITREYWDRYESVSIPPPAAPAVPLESMHPYNQWIQVHHLVDRHQLGEAETAAARRAYLAMASYADDLVGKLLAELDRLRLAEDTLVIFTSDHGDMAGEHGMWFKRTFFDGSAKIPLICRWPGHLALGRRPEVVSLVDLAATLLDIGEVPGKEEWIAGMDGDSFRSLLEGHGGEGGEAAGDRTPGGVSAGTGGVSTGTASWKDRAVCEYYAEGTVAPMLFVRRGRYKYVHVEGERPLLFDLDSDPAEMRDLADDENHAELCRELERELLGGLDLPRLHERILRSQRERLAIADTMADRFHWAHRPVRHAMDLYLPNKS